MSIVIYSDKVTYVGDNESAIAALAILAMKVGVEAKVSDGAIEVNLKGLSTEDAKTTLTGYADEASDLYAEHLIPFNFPEIKINQKER